MLYFNSRFWHFAVISTRIFLGLIFFTGGMSKLITFLLIADYHRLKYILFPRTEALRASPLRRPFLRLDGLTLFGIVLLIVCPTLYGLIGKWAYLPAILGLVCFPASWVAERRLAAG